MKALREEALNQIVQKQKQRSEASASLLNDNKREAVREQMKVRCEKNAKKSLVRWLLAGRRRTESN